MSAAPTNAEKLRGLPWALAHGAGNSVFSQLTFFGPVFVLFLDDLGLPKTRIGLLLSFLPFAGLVALFLAPAVARAGVKRVFLVFWGMRKAVTALLLATPWVLSRYGPEATFYFVSVVVAIFALCRAVAETGFYPWFQEMVPDAIRGQFTAVSGLVDMVAAVLSLAAASYVIDHVPGLERFTWLLGAGVVFGVLCVIAAVPIPGGAPGQTARAAHLGQLRAAWDDANFRHYLGGMGLATVAFMLYSFVPLFMREQVGLAEGQVLRLQVAVYVGGMVSSYLWGWAADRYGSRPVLHSVLFLNALLPIGWLLLPRHSPWSNAAALGVSALAGIASFGWQVSNNRMLYVNVVPSERRTQYMALYYAWIGLLGGGGPLLGGAVVDACAGLDTRFLGLHVDAYTPIFAASLVGLLGARLQLGRVRTDSSMPASDFARLFVRGHPARALRALVRYRLARLEGERIRITEDLGLARSPLSVEGLLEALTDPSSAVRHEAVIAVGRTPPHPRLTAALVEIVDGDSPGLSLAAAWALGRSGAAGGVQALQRALGSDEPLLRAQAARALGQLGEHGSAPAIQALLRAETDAGLRVAFAAALGQLRTVDAAPEVLACLRQSTERPARAELALAVARLIDMEADFAGAWRRLLTQPGTSLAQEAARLARLCRRLGRYHEALLRPRLEEAAQACARDALPEGAAALATAADAVPPQRVTALHAQVLEQVAQGLRQHGAARLEYALLALLGIRAALTGKT